MKRISACVLSLLLFSTALALAQGGPPAPGPEVKKLGYFAGTWKSDGELKPGPMGPGGKFTEVIHSEWMSGGFFLVEHTDATFAGMGKIVEVAYLGYDPRDKSYSYDAFNSVGEAEHAKGSVEGDTWTWSSTLAGPDGKPMKGRFTITIASPTSYTYKFEVAPESGGNYTSILEGKATKVSTAAKKGTEGATAKK